MGAEHPLLVRQLKRHFQQLDAVPQDWQRFIEVIDGAYHEFDLDRGMLERALDLSSQELLQTNAAMRTVHGALELRVRDRTAALAEANHELTNEIAGRKRFETQLVHIASHDPLTDLFNRRRFEEELSEQLRSAEDNSTQGAVLFLDLDQFKDVNDSLGHRAGDDLLKRVGELLASSLRDKDILARPGGDEFAILLPETAPERSRSIANRIQEAIRHHTFLIEGHPISVTASIGVALFPRHGVTTAELFSNADIAMYHAKANGRSRVEVFRTNRDWRSASESRLRWRNRIVEALEDDKFILYAQPIQSLKGAQAGDYEILLRLPTEHGEVVRPGVFLDIAEDFGLIQDIDRWVVRESIRIIAEQDRAGVGVRLAVNLSAKSCGDSDLLSLIRGQLASASVDPANLVAEVTETAAIANLSQTQRFIRTLRDIGCRFSLDDFGSGFSSFYHLKHLPVDYLKIDGAFIKDLAHSDVDQHLVRAMVSVARGLGKQTIAEFVGDRETMDILRALDVDYAQGYYIGRPRDVYKVLSEAGTLRAA